MISAGLFMYPMEPADSHKAPAVRTHREHLQFQKESYSFVLRVLFSPRKIKRRLFADNTIYLPGVICSATSLQSVSSRRTFNQASQHTAINISLLNTELLPVLLFSHSIYSSFIPIHHLNFPFKNSALLHLLCCTFLLPSMCLQN